MKTAFRQFILVFFVVLQCFAPIVHAHTNVSADFNHTYYYHPSYLGVQADSITSHYDHTICMPDSHHRSAHISIAQAYDHSMPVKPLTVESKLFVVSPALRHTTATQPSLGTRHWPQAPPLA